MVPDHLLPSIQQQFFMERTRTRFQQSLVEFYTIHLEHLHVSLEINRIPRYCCPNHHRIYPMFLYWNQAFRIVGFLGCFPNVNSSLCREEREGWLMRPYHECVSSCLMSMFYGRDTIVDASDHYRSLLSVIRGLAMAALPYMLDLGSSHRTVFVGTRSSKMNIQFCSTLWFF
jgi:hypothetical protein